MAQDIPQWAKDRACQLASEVKEWPSPVRWGQAQHYALGHAFARYIAEHEEPPRGPVEEAFQEAFDGIDIASLGGWDRPFRAFQKALAKRGIELSRTLDGSEKL